MLIEAIVGTMTILSLGAVALFLIHYLGDNIVRANLRNRDREAGEQRPVAHPLPSASLHVFPAKDHRREWGLYEAVFTGPATGRAGFVDWLEINSD